MKKFTFTLIAALVAVIAWAQPTALKNRQQLPEQFAVKSVADFKLAPEKKQMAPRPALKAKVQAPVQNTGMRKAPAKVKRIADLSALTTTYIAKNYMYTVENFGTEEEPDYQAVPANLARTAEAWEITLISEEENTVGITGIGGYDETVNATVDAEAGTITIAYGQPVGTTSYGTIGIASATGEAEALVGTITEEGILFQDFWEIDLIDGDYAGYPWSDIYYTEAVLPNGKMTWVDSKANDVEVDVAIDFDAENFVATVWNFADEGVGIDITMKPGNKFAIEPQLVYEGGSTYGDFYTYCADGETPIIRGTGTENTLTFATTWTCYAPSTGYWFGKQEPATITFDGTFTYPVLVEAPATPAAPSVTFFDFESATVTLTVPAVDVDGNDIMTSLLTYQLYTQDAEGNAVALGEPIAYDNEENGAADKKTVELGEEAKGLTTIGVKSIYTALGETNESQITWFEIPQLVEVPEGLEVKEYPVSADAYSGSWDTYKGTALVGVDGTDVYVQGILPHCPNGWAKGTIEDGVVTFPVQIVGSYNNSVYIHLAAYDEGTNGLMPVTFAYDADEDLYMSEDLIFANSNAVKLGFYYPYFDGMTIGEETVPELVELPEGAEVVEYPFVGTTYSSSGSTEFESTVNVAVVENDVYVQGLNEYAPEAWIKGTKDEETGNVIFATGQNLGTLEYDGETYQFFMVGYESGAIADVVMTYNEAQDFYKLQNDLLVNGKKSAISYYKWYEAGTTIGIQTEFDVTFDFNAMDVPVSSGVTTDGDITEDKVLTEENVSLTISPAAEGVTTANRFWGTKNGPQLRVYSGTMTFEVSEGKTITKIVFNNAKWNEGNSADCGEFDGATWTGEAQTVVVTIAGNTQLNSIQVTVKSESKPGPGPQPGDLTTVVYDFEDGTMQGWTTIDADGDGFNWTLGASPSINTVNESKYSVYSESYSSDAGGALTPDNYLVSPQIKLDGSISFYACAQDGEWAAEHFAVAVSTAGNTDAADFTNVEEWTMTASRAANPSFAPGKFRSPRKTPGAWYKYTVDLSSYEGAEGYVAIRHFDCTDNFYIVVDDIEIKTSHVTMPDFTITPAEGTYESLSDFEITFNNYDIAVAEDAAATLKNTTTLDTYVTSFDVEENKILISYEEVTEPGDYTLTVTGVKTAEGNPVELSFNYTIEAAPEVVVLPEGLEAETWYFSATASESNVRNQEVAIAIDGSDIYIQGLNVAYLPEAWVKGTIEGNTATFPTGQYFGAFEYNGTSYDMFFVGSTDGETPSDVVFTIDEEAGTMTTDQYIFINAKKDAIYYYEYYSDVVITHEIPETPDLVALPEGVEAEDWTIDGSFNDSYGSENIVRPTEVAFDGTDIYVKGIPFYFEDAWMKGSIDAETGIATFPTGQFVGEDDYGWEFMVGSDDGETLCDIEFTYDAEAKTLTQLTAFIVENGDTPDELASYGYWTDMFIYAGEPIYEEPIEAPEGLVTDTYLFTAVAIENGAEDLARKVEGEEAATTVTFDFNSLGTEEEPWPVSSGSGDNYDPAGEITEPLVLTEGDVALTISPAEEGATPTRFWKTNNGPQLRVYNGKLTFEAPEGYEMTQIVFNNVKWNENNSADSGEFEGSTWTGNAQSVVVTIGYFNEETGKWVSGNSQINSIEVTVTSEGGEEPEPIVVEPNYSFQTQVGFDGNDVYFKGVSDDTADMWLKGTLSEDGKTVTIPANQYMGEATILWYTFPYYFTAVGEDGETMEDIVLNYDAENNKFTTDQVLVLHDGKRSIGEPYQTFTEVEISKMEEFAATPADPSIDELNLSGNYPNAYFIIPAEDVDGNAILTSKLFYTVWIEEDGVEKPFTAVAGEGFYSKATEDMTEIPYDYNDNYDIYKGGSVFYFNPIDVVANWTKIGIQSIYYGGGERNVSNIVWDNGSVTTGIANVTVETSKNSAVFDLQGRRVAKTAKGLYIMDGKKVVVK